MAAIHENHPPIISGGGIAAFLIGCGKEDAMTTRFSVLGLMNLTTLSENHVSLVNAKVHLALIELASAKKGKKWRTLDSLGELVEEEEPTSPRSRSDCHFLRDHGYDKEARRYAVLALGNLAVSTFAHPHLLKEDCLKALNSSLQSPDDETRFNAAFALNKLSIGDGSTFDWEAEASATSNIAVLGECGCVAGLVGVLTTGSAPAQAQAVAVLRHLAQKTENRFLILQSNALEPLGRLAESIAGVGDGEGGGGDAQSGAVVDREKETLRELTALTCLLTLSEGLRLPLVGSRLLLPLVTFCQHADVEIARHACGTIANIAESKRTHKQLVNKTVNAIHMSVFLMRSKHLSVHREASRIGPWPVPLCPFSSLIPLCSVQHAHLLGQPPAVPG